MTNTLKKDTSLVTKIRVLIIVNRAEFLLSHRYKICLALLKKGYEIHVACPQNNEVISTFKSDGIYHHRVDFFADSLAPYRIFISIKQICSLIKSLRPDVVHSISMKPVLCGGIACRLCHVPAMVSSVSGLGLFFSSHKLKFRVLRFFLDPFLAFCFRHKNHVVILQNDNDRNILLESQVLCKEDTVMIRGSGVDLKVFSYTPEPDGVPIVLFASRLLEDKGLSDLVQAVTILKSQNVKIRLLVAGVPDPLNSNSLSEETLFQWSQAGLIERLGYRDDMSSLLKQANIFCFPSYYGEGVPKVILEAAASGRAVVTTDHPGCRDAVNCNTGLLVPIRNPRALAESIGQLIKDYERRYAMGLAARDLAEKSFCVDSVVEKHIEIYDSLTR